MPSEGGWGSPPVTLEQRNDAVEIVPVARSRKEWGKMEERVASTH